MVDTTDTEEAEEEHTYRSSTARSVQRHIPHAKHILFVRMRVQLLLKNSSNIESRKIPGIFFETDLMVISNTRMCSYARCARAPM